MGSQHKGTMIEEHRLQLLCRLDREPQSHCLGHGNEGGKARISVSREGGELSAVSCQRGKTSDRSVRPTRARVIRSTRGSSASSNAARRYSAANSGLLRSSRIVASSCDVLALRFMVFPLAANTKGGFAAARNLLSRAPRFAPYKPSLTPLPLNVKKERTTASNFGEGPGEIRTHDL